MNHASDLLRLDAQKTGPSAQSIQRHWIVVFGVVYGIFIALPFLAPVLMETAGREQPATCTSSIHSFAINSRNVPIFFSGQNLLTPCLKSNLPGKTHSTR